MSEDASPHSQAPIEVRALIGPGTGAELSNMPLARLAGDLLEAAWPAVPPDVQRQLVEALLTNLEGVQEVAASLLRDDSGACPHLGLPSYCAFNRSTVIVVRTTEPRSWRPEMTWNRRSAL